MAMPRHTNPPKWFNDWMAKWWFDADTGWVRKVAWSACQMGMERERARKTEDDEEDV